MSTAPAPTSGDAAEAKQALSFKVRRNLHVHGAKYLFHPAFGAVHMPTGHAAMPSRIS
eukprot:SAG31_NODE_14168_length_824_cov_0.706207_1_plen_57_part_10